MGGNYKASRLKKTTRKATNLFRLPGVIDCMELTRWSDGSGWPRTRRSSKFCR